MADSGGDSGIFVTIGGTSVPLQEALDAVIPKLGELQNALREAEAAGSGGGGGGGGGFLGGGFGGGFLGMLGEAGHSLDGLGGVLGGAAEKLMAFGSQMWAVTGGMVAFQALSDATQKVQEFADSLVQLNITAENTQFAWGFIFGNMQQQGSGPNAPFVDVSGNSQKIYDFAQKYSLQIPFTRFDEMAAISSMAQIHGDNAGDALTPDQIEQYLPTIADLASTKGKAAYGGRGLTLQQAAYAILEASFGRTIMLKRDLFINPDDLIKDGLDATGTGTGVHINDTSTLLPALKKYAEEHHLAGAAQAAAHQTFSGEWSSFIDRIQLFEQSGGEQIFKELKGDLEGITSWWDAHQPEMNALAKLFGQDLGQGLHFAGEGLQGFVQGLANSPLGQQIDEGMKNLAAFFADPEHQKALADFTTELGQLAGTDLSGLITGLGHVKDGLKNIANSITPEEKDAFKQFFGTDLPNVLKETGMDIGNIGTMIADVNTVMSDIANGAPQSQRDADFKKLDNDNQIAAYEFLTGKPIPPDFQYSNGQYANPNAAAQSGAIHAQPILALLANSQDLVFTPTGYVAQGGGNGSGVVVIYTYTDPITGKRLQCTELDIPGIVARINSWLTYGRFGLDDPHPTWGDGFAPVGPNDPSVPKAGVIGAMRAHDVDESRAGPAVPTSDPYNDPSSNPTYVPPVNNQNATSIADLGAQHATIYLTAFSSTVKDQTGPDLVQAFTDGVNKQLSGSSGAGDILAQRLATFIDQRTRQAIADALANMDLTSAGSRTQAGGPGHQAFTPY